MAGAKKDGEHPQWQQEGEVATRPDDRVRSPRQYQVVLLNDDYTTMEFVVMILMEIFHHPRQRAVDIMLQVHHQGAGVAGVYPYAIAESKARRVMQLARSQGYPLRCTLEPA